MRLGGTDWLPAGIRGISKFFSIHLLLFFYGRFGTRYIRWWKVQFFTADDPVGQLRFSNAQDSIDLDGKVNSLVLIEK